ncbi:indirect negative regulator of sigma-B activity [Pontibacillus halophilus JSM 076056 = DSM 19796]|uniref:Indirect negative regulator of sigma-B activity n=1 Tax=Pontibacillus halophilus JSM 076056 = DSM 19796 TaxID=1385510 RepID=A0A0A5GBN1_9BACI|nr:SpoIIE family protein phosphatase [Pontibacillus halophilus]KGX90581.1 indirect negative regulator of sigma-B activity [Pontibacillus halophilus JSM 076056 = DSM 19796]
MSQTAKMDISVFQKPKKGNYYCGDSFIYKESDDSFICALADGLGSGEYARESSQAIMDLIEEEEDLSIDALVRRSNEVLMKKRGAVLGVLRIDFANESYSYTSIGNIGIIMVTPDGEKKRNIPSAGYLSGYPRPYKVLHNVLIPGTKFFMFSDGVSERGLTKSLVSNNLDHIVDTVKVKQEQDLHDDSTFIAIRYNG